MRILVANRGEIAVRIIKAIHKLGHEAVAVYSRADKDSLHVQLADISVCIGPELASESYLNMLNLLITATSLEVDAIHPGYGFLSENSNFVRLCEELEIGFIGPKATHIEQMGNKINALRIMDAATEGSCKFVEIEAVADLTVAKRELGLPMIIKYALGGGGKGMRIVRSESNLTSSYEMVLSEAKQMEAHPQIFAERFITGGKHVEVQIAADNYGNVKPLGTRDCSLQRNSQKVIEEAPATINPSVSEELLRCAVGIAKQIGYVGVGTVEFMVKGDVFSFLEMNTRLQVEHTVTEQVTGLDLVGLQIEIFEGLDISELNVEIHGHSIECRINAEDPSNNFCPSPGKITKLVLNEDNRNDFGVVSGSIISPFYDSMIGKVIVTDINRKSAIKRMELALSTTEIEGIKTNISFCQKLLKTDDFISNTHTTQFIENFMNEERDVENI